MSFLRSLIVINQSEEYQREFWPAGRQTTRCIVLISTDTDIMQYETLQGYGNILSPTAAMFTVQ